MNKLYICIQTLLETEYLCRSAFGRLVEINNVSYTVFWRR